MTLPEFDTTQLMAIAAALGWASGLRLYAVVFITGLVGQMGWVPLPEGLKMLQHPAVLGASGFMLAVEFFADKIPGLDSLWDVIHTVLRVPAGAALAASVFGADQGTLAIVAALLGGSLAATAHTAKATTRAAVNTSPEPFSNVAVSLVEDGAAVGSLWLAYTHPLVFIPVLAVAVIAMLGLIWVLWKFLRRIAQRVRGVFAPASATV
jgi:Domain of unknown function (DUF4126)